MRSNALNMRSPVYCSCLFVLHRLVCECHKCGVEQKHSTTPETGPKEQCIRRGPSTRVVGRVDAKDNNNNNNKNTFIHFFFCFLTKRNRITILFSVQTAQAVRFREYK